MQPVPDRCGQFLNVRADGNAGNVRKDEVFLETDKIVQRKI